MDDNNTPVTPQDDAAMPAAPVETTDEAAEETAA